MSEQGEVASRSTIAEHRTADAVAIALASADRRLDETAAQLKFADEKQKEYFERIIKDRESATQLAETEREKAASALRMQLEREIASGDFRLQDHIEHQVEQVRQGLAALQSLLSERDGRMDDRFKAHKEAIQKAEDSLNKRLEAMNAVRDQLREQASTFSTREQLEATTKQLSTLIERNREDIADSRGVHLTVATFDQAVAEWTAWRNKVDVRNAESTNNVVSRRTLEDILEPIVSNLDAVRAWQFKIAGALIFVTVVLPGVVAFAVYLLTRHAVPVDNGLAK